MMTPIEVAKHIAVAVKEKRLSLNLSQQTTADRSGVSYGVIKKFERTGKISLGSLLKIALALGCLTDFMKLFRLTPSENLLTLDELLKQKVRRRGRK